MRNASFPQYELSLFEEVLPNKMKVLCAPNKDIKETRFGLYVPIGSYNHTEKIANTKIPNGISKFLSVSLKYSSRGNIEDLLKKEEAYLETFVTESYTYYQLKCLGDYEKPLEILLAMVSNFTINEESVEKARQEIIKEKEVYFENPLNQIDDELRKSLYIGSPIRNSIFGDEIDIKSIHLNTLKKFFFQYYSVDNMTLFSFGNLDAFKLSEKLASIKMVNSFKKQDFQAIKYEENYGTSLKSSVTLQNNEAFQFVSIGIKMLPRQELYTQYKNDLFSIYELLPRYIFSENNKYISKLYDDNTIIKLINSGVREGSEDSYLYATFLTQNPRLLKQKLLDYIANSEKSFDTKGFKLTVKQYYGEMIATFGSIDEFEKKLVDVYANHIAFPALVSSTKNFKVSTLRTFVKHLLDSPVSTVITVDE